MSVKIVINEVIFYNFTVLLSVFTEVLTGSGNAVFTRVNTTKPWISPRLFAVWTRLELATPCVTGMYSNQLNYQTSLGWVSLSGRQIYVLKSLLATVRIKKVSFS